MSKQKVYQKLAGIYDSYLNCVKLKNEEWGENHKDHVNKIISHCMPHGSGIDADNIFNFNKSKQNKLVIDSSFHTMNENGFYDGWIDFSIIITPSLAHGLNIDIKGKFGKKHQDLKDYLADLYYSALTE